MRTKKKYANRIGFAVSFIILVSGVGQAQPAPKNLQEMPMDAEKMQQHLEGMRAEFEKQEIQRLEELKKRDPKAYEQQKAQYDRQKKISQLLQAYHDRKLSDSSAAQQLYPLIKADVNEEAKSIDERIEQAKQYLTDLQEIKRNPELLIKRRIDRLLGKGDPGRDGFGAFLR